MGGILSQLVAGLFGRSSVNSRSDLDALLVEAEHARLIRSNELEMLRGVLALLEIRVKDVMIPQGKVSWLDLDDDLPSMLAEIRATGHSRYPVHTDEEAGVAGILHVKDLFNQTTKTPNYRLAIGLLRPAHQVPESKSLNSMLCDFQKHRVHMAVVADEYGNPSGLVTIEDVLERIVGAIHDEFDAAEGTRGFDSSSAKQDLLDGATSIEEFGERFGSLPEAGKSGTIGGWIANQLGRMPVVGDRLEHGERSIVVTAMAERRVETIQVLSKRSKLNRNSG